MSYFSSFLVAIFFAAGVYLLMRRNAFEVLLGSGLLGQATFILLISMSGWQEDTKPPLLEHQDGKTHELVIAEQPTAAQFNELQKIAQDRAEGYVDPLPQALILTAIVIGFGVTSFLIVLVARSVQETETLEFGELAKEEHET